MCDGHSTVMLLNKMFDIEVSAEEAIEVEQTMFSRLTDYETRAEMRVTVLEARVDKLVEALTDIAYCKLNNSSFGYTFCKDTAKTILEELNFDPIKERDAAYDQGYKDAKREQTASDPLQKGYFGHEAGCDCNVCENMMMGEARRQRKEKEKERIVNLERQLSEAQAEIEKWETIAGQITTDWIPANRKLSEEIERLTQKSNDLEEMYSSLYEHHEEAEAKLARYEENEKLWAAQNEDNYKDNRSLEAANHDQFKKIIDLEKKPARYEQGVECTGDITLSKDGLWYIEGLAKHLKNFNSNYDRVRVLVMPYET